MSEIEKMYEKVGVKKQIPKVCSSNELYCKECEAHIEDAMPYCKNADYPPFTAEKQILLIQWLLDKTDIYLHRHKTDFTYSIASGNYAVNKYKDFKESIAEFINTLWQDLTESEQEQIADILKG